jgi:hypothetical protein
VQKVRLYSTSRIVIAGTASRKMTTLQMNRCMYRAFPAKCMSKGACVPTTRFMILSQKSNVVQMIMSHHLAMNTLWISTDINLTSVIRLPS